MAAIKQQTHELIDLIDDYVKGNLSYDRKPFDLNHFFHRNFRLYIEGSYAYPHNEPGYKFAERLKKRILDIYETPGKSKEKKLLSLVIEMFMNMLSVEFDELSRSTIQKLIVKHFKKSDLDELNRLLVQYLGEYAKENIQEKPVR